MRRIFVKLKILPGLTIVEPREVYMFSTFREREEWKFRGAGAEDHFLRMKIKSPPSSPTFWMVPNWGTFSELLITAMRILLNSCSAAR